MADEGGIPSSMTYGEKLTKWLIFSVLLALLPVVFNLILLGFGISQSSLSLNALLGNGELLLIAATLCAAGLGDLVASGTTRRIRKYVLTGAVALVLITASGIFALAPVVNADSFGGEGAAAGQLISIPTASIWFFGFSVVAGAACLAMGEN